MKIDYSNMPQSSNKIIFGIKYYLNLLRTWYLFHFLFPWVKYKGFVRVMAHTRFAKRNISIGNRVQFGKYCIVTTDVKFGNNILIASYVGFIGKHDHIIDIPCLPIWDSPRGINEITIVEDDVWIGHNSTIIAGVTIGAGSIVAAGSLVNKDIPPCEVWAGVPAKKIKNRFINEEDKFKHLSSLKTIS